MINLTLHGCSFTKNINRGKLVSNFSNNSIIKNYANESNSNLKILNSFKENLIPNSTAIIQWSSLTRPNDNNFYIMHESDNPLWDLLDEWYVYLDEVRTIANKNNIKLIQYIGWAQWKDYELNEYHRNRLTEFDIDWFLSEETLDIIPCNCFQFEDSNSWSSPKLTHGYYQWPFLKWGGIAEWIRTNIETDNRYMGYEHNAPTKHFDTHPSRYATDKFVNEFLLPKIKLIN
jgi:hypothetical protein